MRTTYSVGIGVSLPTLGGVWWPVIEDHGKCGCGAVDMCGIYAYCGSRESAQEFCNFKNSEHHK